MKGEDFAAWLSAISGLNEGQRTEAIAALEKASAVGAEGRFCEEGRPAQPPKGRAGNDQSRARRGSGLSSLRGTRGRRLGPLTGLLRFRCKSCGRTFNALTKTPMAHLRKKEKWLDHARAMIEGKSLAKTAQLCGVHPTTAFRWRHRFLRAPAVNKPRSLSGIVEADETFVLESFKGRWSDLPRPARQRGGKARHPGPYQDNIPVLVARDRKGATFDAVLPQVDGASIGRALAGVVTQDNHLIGRPIAAFARRAGIPFHAVLAPGKPAPQAPHLHINNVNAYHRRLKQWLNRFNGVATKNLPNYLGWRRALEAWGDKLEPPNWIKGAIGNGPYQQISL